jgi:hypothetical protein
MLRLFTVLRLSPLVGCLLLVGIAGSGAWGQENDAQQQPFRKLAPGVVTEIPPELEEDEMFSGPREMTELLAMAPDLDWDPKTLAESETLASMAKDVVFRRSIWGLEFGFKPLRIIDVDLTMSDGSVRPSKVYYLVYYVKNNGRHLVPSPVEDEQGHVLYSPKPVDHTIRFFPTFELKAHDTEKAYLDEVLPEAVAAIRRREDANRALHNSVTITTQPIPVSTEYEDNSVWGVVTWTGVDPESDFFSVFVKGLTNAYQFQDPPGAFTANDPPLTGRRFSFKTLQLNFWRPGDALETTEDEIRYGVPNQNQVPAAKSMDEVLDIYRLKERVDYLWMYR